MSIEQKKNIRSILELIVCGIIINLFFIWIAKITKLPIYLDSIGTILAASAGGLLPGIAVGFFSNCIASFSNVSADPMTMYYGFLSALIAVIAVFFSKRNDMHKWKGILLSIFVYAFVGGGLGSIVTWILYGFSFGTGISSPLVYYFFQKSHINPFIVQFIVDLGVDILDKFITVLIVWIIMRNLPAFITGRFSTDYLQKIKGKNNKDRKVSINIKISFWIIFLCSMISVVSIVVGGVTYWNELRSGIEMEKETNPSNEQWNSMVRAANIQEASFVGRMASMLFGMMIFVAILTIWICDKHLLSPIRILAMQARDIDYDGGRIGNRVRDHYSVDTGDELEEVFLAMCRTEDKITVHMKEIKEKNHEIAKMQRNIIFTLANMVENRDGSTGGHIKRTANYVRLIGKKLLDQNIYPEVVNMKYIQKLYDSAPLHDIGKIKISDAILNKPGKLTAEEYEIMKTHTIEGKKILQDSLSDIEDDSWLIMAVDMAMYHHEKWDGSGYPEGLSQNKIPLCARIMAVADVFDALVSERAYKTPFTFEQAIQIMKEGSGKQFDPQILEAFLGAENNIRFIMEQDIV